MTYVQSRYTALQTTWKALLDSPLVKDGNLTKENIDEFKSIINMVAPNPKTVNRDVTIGDTYRHLYNQNSENFLKYLRDSDNQCCVLHLDGSVIASELGLGELIEIIWSRNSQQFFVHNLEDSRRQQKKPRSQRQQRNPRQHRGPRDRKMGDFVKRPNPIPGEDVEFVMDEDKEVSLEIAVSSE